MRLLVNLSLLQFSLMSLHQLEEWVNTKTQSEDRVNAKIMRLLINLLLLHQSEERRDPVRGEGEHREPVQANPLHQVYERHPENFKSWREVGTRVDPL